ncbi:outer membrane protein [Agarivorans sp. Toyoura001]|uniref:porin n=1 Tax=Agarivorans sp. Toyoura001 TaxID=2283141 RepID=UPI0010EE8731|nr:porin [Agarivorans sp. Toyoura001]GDY27515.1 outer membrane protein [Agarivorans sp. Toyoura001]
MKKTILAVAIPALFAASAQAATVYDADGVTAEVYGRMQFEIQDEGGENSKVDGIGSARMGFKAKSEIASGINALARGEWQVNAENSDGDDEQLAARHVYAGFEFDEGGTVVFGQTDTAFYQAVAATDIFNKYGYEAFDIIESGRQEGQVVYNGEFGGFYVGASYQFRDDNFKLGAGNPDAGFPSVKTDRKLDNSYAATIGYNFDFGLGVYGGYHAEDFEVGDKKNMALSASYSLNDLYLAAVYVKSDLSDIKWSDAGGVVHEPEELTGYDIVASYDINAVSLYTGYAFQEAEGKLAGVSGKADTAKAFKLGAQYKFNSNMKAWAEYLNDGLEGADDKWNIAVQYNF